MSKAKNIVAELFMNSPRCQQQQSIGLSMLSVRFRKDTWQLSYGKALLLIQPRTGHIPLCKQFHRIGKTESPKFWTCPMIDKTVHHYLFACLRYTSQWRQLEATLWRATRSISDLLVNPKAFPYLFMYILDMH